MKGILVEPVHFVVPPHAHNPPYTPPPDTQLKKEDIPVPSLELRAEISDKAVVEDGILPGDSLSLTITHSPTPHTPFAHFFAVMPDGSQIAIGFSNRAVLLYRCVCACIQRCPSLSLSFPLPPSH